MVAFTAGFISRMSALGVTAASDPTVHARSKYKKFAVYMLDGNGKVASIGSCKMDEWTNKMKVRV